VNREIPKLLRARGVQPSSQRVAIAEYVLFTDEHPGADDVWERVKKALPVVSRATVYNTLNLFVEKGLLKQLVLAEGRVVFDPKVDKHYHFIDEVTGAIHDVPWDAVKVASSPQLPGFEITEYQVVLRGRVKTKRSR
jgi:Fur family transcriptional regulator, iron response regulator